MAGDSVSKSSGAARSSNPSKCHRPASLRQISAFCGSGSSTESMPSRLTWRRMKGSTVAGICGDATRPQAATLHP